MKIFKNAINSLFKSRDKIRKTFSDILSFSKLNDEEKEKIENCLLSSDIGWELTEKIINNLETSKSEDSWEELLIKSIKKSIANIDNKADSLRQIIIVIGVNGSGKTTSAAKLAKYLKVNKKKVTLVAADTFRAAAVEQLNIWADRIGIDFISRE